MFTIGIEQHIFIRGIGPHIFIIGIEPAYNEDDVVASGGPTKRKN